MSIPYMIATIVSVTKGKLSAEMRELREMLYVAAQEVQAESVRQEISAQTKH
jgi:hypothetical protein